MLASICMVVDVVASNSTVVDLSASWSDPVQATVTPNMRTMAATTEPRRAHGSTPRWPAWSIAMPISAAGPK